MTYKEKRLLKIAIIAAIILVSIFLYQYYGINLGMDLEGGAQIIMEARPEDREIDSELMGNLRTILEQRVNSLGLSDVSIQVQGDKRLLIELPAVEDPAEAIEMLGQTALLTFRNPAGEVLMTGDMVEDASPSRDQFNRPVVVLEFSSEGRKRFEEITAKYVNQRIGIYLDEDRLTNPMVNEVIRSSSAQVSGYDTFNAATEDAVLIREGALPVPVERVSQNVVGPTLGRISIQQSLTAGLLALLLVAVYMIYYYRFPGALAALVLIIYGIIMMGTMAALRAVLTLPGIAGLILSIGMAVDANIIIFERIKDERQNGKSLKAAINSGFKRAYITIFDANITTIITALILASFTTGVVRGFAFTLGIGVLVSMFTAFFVTRNIIDLFSNTKLLKDSNAFGVQRGLS